MSTWPNRGASGGPCGGLEEGRSEQPKQSDHVDLTLANRPPRNPVRFRPPRASSVGRSQRLSPEFLAVSGEQMHKVVDVRREDPASPPGCYARAQCHYQGQKALKRVNRRRATSIHLRSERLSSCSSFSC